MKTENYNLIEEDWIPVLMKDGSFQRVSLEAVFSNRGEIADLSLNAYERVAVMRLLICIAMAALDEKDIVNEAAWRNAKGKMGSAVKEYFKNWHNRFNFYGPHAFLQPDGLTIPKGGKASSVDKLVLSCASGNNGTLFDHAARGGERVWGHPDKVISMLVYLNFSAGGQHPKCRWDDVETSVNVKAGPSREKSMVHSFLIGESLYESVWLGLLTGEMISHLPNAVRGRPVWESEFLDRKWMESKDESVMARLVPLSRVMKLKQETSSLPLGEGLKFAALPNAREPMAAVRGRSAKKGDDELTYVSLSAEEAPWRSLHAIVSFTEHHGALTLRHVQSCKMERISLWSGGLLTDGKAKDVAALEWRFTIPGNFIEDSSLTAYKRGVEKAKEWSDGKLWAAAKKYCEAMYIDSKNDFVLPRSRKLFWDELEKFQPRLVEICCNGSEMDEWEKIVKTAARCAFEEACPHQTGRQLVAYVKAVSKLNDVRKGGKK